MFWELVRHIARCPSLGICVMSFSHLGGHYGFRGQPGYNYQHGLCIGCWPRLHGSVCQVSPLWIICCLCLCCNLSRKAFIHSQHNGCGMLCCSLGRSSYIKYWHFFCMEDLSLIPYLLVYSNIYLYQYRPSDMYFILWVGIWYCLFILLLKLF